MNTTYFLNLVAGNVFRSKTTPAIPTSYYLGASTTAPTVAGNNVTEPASDTGYTRVQLSALGTPTDGMVSNTASVEFPESTKSWGTLTHFVVYDAATGGNLLMFGSLPARRVVDAATIMMIPAGDLKLSVINPSA